MDRSDCDGGDMSRLAQLETRSERLFREFVEAQERAKKSMRLEDGIAAGRAWSAFLAEYVPDRDTRAAVHGSAVGRK
jgi:hypothetical protein